MSTYLFENAAAPSQSRLDSLEYCFDGATRANIEALGISEGWRCLEVGSGNGSVAHWLAERVGPAGTVIATDIDPSLMCPAMGNLEIRQPAWIPRFLRCVERWFDRREPAPRERDAGRRESDRPGHGDRAGTGRVLGSDRGPTLRGQFISDARDMGASANRMRISPGEELTCGSELVMVRQ